MQYVGITLRFGQRRHTVRDNHGIRLTTSGMTGKAPVAALRAFWRERRGKHAGAAKYAQIAPYANVEHVVIFCPMIYAIRAVGTPFIKIGITSGDGSFRLDALQTGCPYELVLIAQCDWPDEEERRIHRVLREHRQRGEWFRDHPKVAAVVRAMAGSVEDWHKLRISFAPHRLRIALQQAAPQQAIPSLTQT